MTDTIDAFPQHRAGKRKGKPTIAEIVNDGIKTGQTPMAIFATVGALYPKTKLKDIKAAFDTEIERQQAKVARGQQEIASMEALMAVVKPIMREPGNKGMTVGQALKIAADRGDERAKAYLAHFESAEEEAFWRDFKAAVALDPYWEMSEDGRSATRLPGARHKTTEELVAAYRVSRPGGARHG
jgi:hypothetical protein